MLRRANRIAHIVQAIEKRHQVKALAGIFLGGRDLEFHPIRHARLGGGLLGQLN